MAESDQCMKCSHYLGAHSCLAFPEGIPEDIMTGLHDHHDPYNGDNGYRFQLSAEFKEIDESV